MDQIHVAIAGGSPLLQAGIAAALDKDKNSCLKVVAQLRDARELASQLGRLRCDVVIVNSCRPCMDAGLVLGGLKQHDSPIKLVILTSNGDRDEMVEALRLGVHGYGICRHLTPEDVLAAVLTVSRWGTWACPSATRLLMATAVEPVRPQWVNGRFGGALSDREVQVLTLAAHGAKEPHIAEALFLTRNTVKTYLRRICLKLGVRSRAEAIRLGIERGLIPDRRRATYSAA